MVEKDKTYPKKVGVSQEEARNKPIVPPFSPFTFSLEIFVFYKNLYKKVKTVLSALITWGLGVTWDVDSSGASGNFE